MNQQIARWDPKENTAEEKTEGMLLIKNNPHILKKLLSKKSDLKLWEKEPSIQMFFGDYENFKSWRLLATINHMAEEERRDRESGKIVPIKKTNDYIEHHGSPFSTYTPRTVKAFIKSASQVSLASGIGIGAIGAIVAAGIGAPAAAAASLGVGTACFLGFIAYPLTKALAMSTSEHAVDSYGSKLYSFWDKARFKTRKFLTLAFGTATLALSLFTFIFHPYNAHVQAKCDDMIDRYSVTEAFSEDYVREKNAAHAAFESGEISFAEYEEKLKYLDSVDFRRDSFMNNATPKELEEYEKATNKARKTSDIAATTTPLTVAAIAIQPLQSETLKELED